MSKVILILRNTPRENPGLIESVLTENSLIYQIIDFDHTTVIPPVENLGALIVLGGPESANDLSPKMLSEISLIRQAINSEIPFLGICLGLQAFVKAMGGEVVTSDPREIGFRDPYDEFYKIRITPEGRGDMLFNNLPDLLTVFQLHGETVIITPRMTLIASGDFCRNQIVKYGFNAYGIQSHFELTKDLLESWINEDSDLQTVNADQLRSDFDLIKTEYEKTGRQIFTNFLIIAGFVK